ncbi:MAG TPA: hypothetical protein VFY18_08085 [Candidatus Limnocylindrales bacterium]|nr:hypothetical protein [Candidatus Limnocylindrales bacterium]
MIAFLVDLENKTGALAGLAEALGAKGINITGVAGATCGDSGRAAITTADDAAARSVFEAMKVGFKEFEATEVSIAHSPGTLGKVARRLADAGVNIEAIMPTGMDGNNVSVAFVTNNPAKAKEILATEGVAR